MTTTLNTPLMEERIARKQAVNELALLRMELEEAATDRDRYKRERDLALKEVERMREALDSIYIYANDTLSGRADGGPDDRAWQRQAVVEVRNRARVFATVQSAVDARAALETVG